MDKMICRDANTERKLRCNNPNRRTMILAVVQARGSRHTKTPDRNGALKAGNSANGLTFALTKTTCGSSAWIASSSQTKASNDIIARVVPRGTCLHKDLALRLCWRARALKRPCLVSWQNRMAVSSMLTCTGRRPAGARSCKKFDQVHTATASRRQCRDAFLKKGVPEMGPHPFRGNKGRGQNRGRQAAHLFGNGGGRSTRFRCNLSHSMDIRGLSLSCGCPGHQG